MQTMRGKSGEVKSYKNHTKVDQKKLSRAFVRILNRLKFKLNVLSLYVVKELAGAGGGKANLFYLQLS